MKLRPRSSEWCHRLKSLQEMVSKIYRKPFESRHFRKVPWVFIIEKLQCSAVIIHNLKLTLTWLLSFSRSSCRCGRCFDVDMCSKFSRCSNDKYWHQNEDNYKSDTMCACLYVKLNGSTVISSLMESSNIELTGSKILPMA